MSTKSKPLVLTVAKIVAMAPALQKLSQNENLPISTSFRVGRLVSQLQPELERFEKTRTDIIKKYGKEVELPKEAIDQGVQPQYRIPAGEKQDRANADMDALTNEEIQIPAWKPLKMVDFGDGSKTTPQEFAALLPLLHPDFLDDGELDDDESVINTNMQDRDQPPAVPAATSAA